jgi:DNA-binding MarR family transcriptional regulator
MTNVAGQSISEAQARELAVALHDLAWLLPRTLDPPVEASLDRLPASELEVMRALVRRPGLSLGALAAELALAPSNASTAVRALVARGLLERRGDPGDGRVTRLYPTAAAVANRRARERAWGRALRSQLRHLDEAQRAAAVAAAPALRTLADRLAASSDAPAVLEPGDQRDDRRVTRRR